METVGKLPPDFAPGDAWAYSNTNYALLGWIIEDVTNEPYSKFIEEKIIRPIGMVHTRFAEHGIEARGLVRGYVMRRRARAPSPRGAASIKADGALISNLADLIKWCGALNDQRLVNRKSYQAIWARAKLNSGRSHPYGMGWYLNLPGAKGYMGHSGQSAGYSAGISRYPGSGISVILLTNMYNVGAEAMTKKIAALYDPTLATPPFVATSDPDPKRTDRVKLAIQAIATNNLDETLFEREYLLPFRSRRNRQVAPATWGRLKSVDSMEFGTAKPQGADTYLTYRVGSGPYKFIVTVLWTAQGKLAQATIAAEPQAQR
jgi:CubicO group peptidase (beta-lactamase class C family)